MDSSHLQEQPMEWIRELPSCIFNMYNSKMLEHIICSHVPSHMDKHDILTCYNHGFHASYSSCSPPMTSWPEWLARSRWMWQCWISVRHSTLFPTSAFSRSWSPLVYLGDCGLLSWIRSFLTARTQQVVIKAVTPKFILWPLGGSSGDRTGALTFLVFY